MEAINLLPSGLRARSLNPREIVLSYEDAFVAIDCLASHGWAMLGWEGWIRYPDGSVSPSARHQGTLSILYDRVMSWEQHVSEAAQFCRETMLADQQGEKARPEALGGTLYFCLSAISQADV